MRFRHSLTRMMVLLVVGILMTAYSAPAAYADSASAEMLEKFWVDTYGSVTTTPETMPYVAESYDDFDYWPVIDPFFLSYPSLDATVPCIPRYEIELLAKAKPDECFTGLSSGLVALNKFLLTYPQDLDCTDCVNNQGGQPKVNQAYVWGLTKSGPDIWFGTAANVLCLVLDGFLQIDIPMQNDSWVCEQGPDVRPPRLFIYHTKPDAGQDALEDITPVVLAAGSPHNTRLLSTFGIRSAGSHNGVVFFGGLNTSGKVVMFAFNAATKAYLDSKVFSSGDENYTNIRQWIVANKQLYVGVGIPGAITNPLGGGGGKILRWKGSVSDPFQFETVGVLKGDPAYLAEHEGRLFANTWGYSPDTNTFEGAALYMSPLFGNDQMLKYGDRNDWTVVWKLSDYEVEKYAFQVGGAMHSYGAYLYWGTMQVPLMSLELMALDPNSGFPTTPSASDYLAAFLGTNRPICIFRGKNFGKKAGQVKEVLYGTTYLPKYDSGTWTIVPNNMGQVPKFGLAGFNNFFNNYTWWMEFYHGRLFVGTMDWSYLLAAGLEDFAGVTIPQSLKNLAQNFYGADLYRFVSLDLPAIPVSLSGAGNYLNYGIRTMVSDDCLYLGSANPMNLKTDPNDLPNGGWELRKLRIRDCD